MADWSFRLILAGIELTGEQLDALYEAGCDDASFSLERDGSAVAFFDRAAKTQEDAVLSALRDIGAAQVGARVVKVATDDDWLAASELAERVGRTRQSIGLLVRGDRGPGDFPAPVARRGSTNPLWSWDEVEAWFQRYEPGAVAPEGWLQ
jgi:hypothetical protein